MDRRHRDEPLETDALLFLRSLGAVAGRFPVWLVSWLLLAVLALAVALPWYGSFELMVEHRYEPGSLVHSLDRDFRFDHREGLDTLARWSASTGALLALVAALLGVFVSGGWLQVILERARDRSLRRFFFGGARYFGRFFRLWLLTLLVLALWHWVLYELPWQRLVLEGWMGVPESDWTELETLESEASAVRLRWAQDALFAVAFGCTLAWGTYSRTRMALHEGRSAVWAGCCAAFTLLRHPIKTLRPMLLLFLVELFALLAVAGTSTQWLESGLEPGRGTATGRILVMFAIGQMALMWRQITRGASYHAAVQVSREVVAPPPRPDPWKSIGGPGGPQYPVDAGDDEFGVAL